jgi:EmrB/QacA subfamily drug resistance transporter
MREQGSRSFALSDSVDFQSILLKPLVPERIPLNNPSGRSLFLNVFPSITLPMFLAVVDQTIVATALPAIAASLGHVERVSWVVVSYLISTTIAAPVYGQLGDVVGRRTMMFVALGIFIASSVLCALAISIETLTIARVLQGLGGGGLMTLSQALVGEAIPPRARARYQGYLATVAVTANAFGPVAGGYLTSQFGWQSVFLINVPIGILAVLLTLRLEQRSGGGKWWRFDAPGLFLFITFIAPVILSLEQIQKLDLRSLPVILTLLTVGAISVFLLVKVEQRTSEPLLPISLLRQSVIWRTDALAACHGAALVSLITFLPIYLEVVRDMSSSQAGLILVPLMVGIGIGSISTGRAVSKTGQTTIFPIVGLIMALVCLLVLSLLAPHLSTFMLSLLLLWNGLSMGTVMGVVQVTVQTASGSKMLGAGAATVQFSRSVGAAFGTAIVAAVLFSMLSASDAETARLFAAMVNQGAAAMAELSATRRAVVQAEVTTAFRAAFVTIAAFASIGLLCAWTIPMRRIA